MPKIRVISGYFISLPFMGHVMIANLIQFWYNVYIFKEGVISMKKRILSLALVFVMLFVFVPAAGAESNESTTFAPDGVYELVPHAGATVDACTMDYLTNPAVGATWNILESATLTVSENGEKVLIFFNDGVRDYTLEFVYETRTIQGYGYTTDQEAFYCTSIDSGGYLDDYEMCGQYGPGSFARIGGLDYSQSDEYFGPHILITGEETVQIWKSVDNTFEPAMYFWLDGIWVPVESPTPAPTTAVEAIDVLADKGVIVWPEYWYEHYGDLTYLDALLINLANLNYTNSGSSVTTVEQAIDQLAAAGAIGNKAYWLQNYSQVLYLDSLLIKAANML